ncbi:class I SAM-dependent methyltransferase [Tepidiforma thermophila]|uniref:Methyltransferase family protein n=1 Tax=Tepidiforma thermophila (strain KCTC 52669 / CGMCC 1.13589 / G233) TaxID=2761530 RepID=A0A2A9HJ19_TEPT2|nr:class I SAM-dependent methyltransferase [Tepidiforma thermophila]PFG74996.1 methyltransferase family protein [Tepidiforma thermophila]
MADQSILQPGNLLMVQERERYLARLFVRVGWTSLAELRAFEAGCSTGYNLRQLVQWGAKPQNVAGQDIDPAAVTYCRSRASDIRVHEGSAERIPEPDRAFDLALAFTLFSSVADEDVAQRIAAELVRITRPGGLIVVYDMRRRNPANPNVHPVLEDDIRRWFPRCPMRVKTLTLAPPIARRVGRFAPWLYGPLAAIPPFRTHAMYVLRRPGQVDVFPAARGTES